MIKRFLIASLLFSSTIYARQIILVVADDFNTSQAELTCYENSHAVFSPIRVNIGRNGLAWDINDNIFIHAHNEPTKHEGDGKAPAGVFALTGSFGYDDENFSLPFTKSDANRICVDDVNSSLYNRIVTMPQPPPTSFEYMKRDDEQYKIGAVVDYNPNKIQGLGSCIFLHVEKFAAHPTAGCTSMAYENLKKVLLWLKKEEKPVLVQVPKKSLPEVKKVFGIE